MVLLICQVMGKLISSTDNELFAHYIFMDNKFTMSTASGLPLTFALSGTFAPGAKGGLHMTPKMVPFPFEIRKLNSIFRLGIEVFQ